MTPSKGPKIEPTKKGRDPVESGEWIDPFDKNAPKKLSALDAKTKARELVKKNKLENKVSLQDLKKLTPEDLLIGFNMEKIRDTFINKNGNVDFKLPKFEKNIGLRDLFDEKSPLLLVADKNENKRYVERKRNGNYYYVGTNRKALIYSGDMVQAPESKAELASWKKDAENDRRENIRIAKKRKQRINNNIAQQGKELAAKKAPKEMSFQPEIIKHSEKFLTARKERVKAIKDYLALMNFRNKKLLPLPKDLLASQIYKRTKKLGPLKRADVEFIKATAKEYDRLIRSSEKGMKNGEAIRLALGNVKNQNKLSPTQIAQADRRKRGRQR